MQIKINIQKENKFKKININGNNLDDKVEFEGCMVSKVTVDRILKFRKQHSNSIIEKPEIPTVDSKGNKINCDNNPSYVRLIRKEEYPTYIKSKTNSAVDAMMYSLFEQKWIETPKLWQDYVYDGSLGLDYEYVDDTTIRDFIKKNK